MGVIKYLIASNPDYNKSEEEQKELFQKAEKHDAECQSYPPAEKLSATNFLGYKGFSDDDRAYFWKPDGDVHFSQEMKEWMAQLRAELQEIESNPEVQINKDNLLKQLVDLLSDANKAFGMIYMFRETFYDFLSHPEDPKRQASVVLLQRLIERGKTELPSPNSDSWLAWHEKRFSPARQRLKRYLAILGNLELRKGLLRF